VTTPDPPPHLDVYESWIERGLHGEMRYLERDQARQRRADPREILPECRSILVLGARHHAPPPPANPHFGKPSGRVAAYAWGEDYHKALKPGFEAIIAFIEDRVGFPIPNKWYTDTGPLLERELAQRAGLGWIGKNTCLINPRNGSYFLLGEILLGIDLEPDAPMAADHCGSCSRCIEACPTACILPDRTIDARRCISYLTIELKGAIPLDLRAKVGDWVFGCDICQEVCPWNIRFSQDEGMNFFDPRPGVPQPDLRDEIYTNQEGFSEKFKGSPIKRPGRDGYVRNLAVAMGNSGDRTAVPDLTHALLDDPSALVRGHAAWALGQLRGSEAAESLKVAARSETDRSTLEEISLALIACEGKG
jgi:epoxyqueuosine reductase